MKAKVLILGLICLFIFTHCKKNLPTSPDLSSVQSLTINYFTATPTEILCGEYSILSWSVSNALKVTIDQDIGEVSAIGTIEVSPADKTVYTLCAYEPVDSDQLAITECRAVIVDVKSGANLKIIGESQFTFTCTSLSYWRLGLNITIANVGNKEAFQFVIWCRIYSDPNAVPDENYNHESYMGAVGFRIYRLLAGSEEYFVLTRSVNENEEGNECELVKNGKIVIDLDF